MPFCRNKKGLSWYCLLEITRFVALILQWQPCLTVASRIYTVISDLQLHLGVDTWLLRWNHLPMFPCRSPKQITLGNGLIVKVYPLSHTSCRTTFVPCKSSIINLPEWRPGSLRTANSVLIYRIIMLNVPYTLKRQRVRCPFKNIICKEIMSLLSAFVLAAWHRGTSFKQIVIYVLHPAFAFRCEDITLPKKLCSKALSSSCHVSCP